MSRPCQWTIARDVGSCPSGDKRFFVFGHGVVCVEGGGGGGQISVGYLNLFDDPNESQKNCRGPECQFKNQPAIS